VLQFKQPFSTIEPEPDSRWDPPGSNTAAQLVAIKGEEP
jgi:hypothetical protein